MILTDKAHALILEHEGMSARPDWPGGQSGVTIGFGYDVGFVSEADFRADWKAYLPAAWLDRLSKAIGVKGEKAKELLPELCGITIKLYQAMGVFERKTVPKYFSICREAFGGFDRLPPDAQGAVLSLVYNRGARMEDKHPAIEERREMRAIRNLIGGPSNTLSVNIILRGIAEQLRSMERLWTGTLPAPYNVKMGGLVRRREDEAKLVEQSIHVTEATHG